MKCDNDHCIYNSHYKCTLSHINLSNMGVCEDCVMVRFGDEDLQKEKERILASYNKNAFI